MTEPILQFFTFEHLPPHLQEVSAPFGMLARILVKDLPRNPERTVALRKLLEAKDAAVRARLYQEPAPMALLDVNEVIVDPDFASSFEVIRRSEAISVAGRPIITEAAPVPATGSIYPTGDNSLVRQADYEHGLKTATCVTPFRLQMASDGQQPDIVLFRGNRFIVSQVEDYTQYGRGFVVAQLSSIKIIDQPPQ